MLAIRPASPLAPPQERPSVIVVSHERSGTHFLINSLQRAYGYPSPHWPFDWQTLKIDYRNPKVVGDVLATVGSGTTLAIVKSHHAAGFLDGALNRVLRNSPILYIHRDPVDVMISFWRYSRRWLAAEMAHAATATDFALSPPTLSMIRYQTTFCRTVLERWGRHVDGWTAAAEKRPRIMVVRYDQLRDDYAGTVSGFAASLGAISGPLTPPDRVTNVVAGMAADQLPAPDRIALGALARQHVGRDHAPARLRLRPPGNEEDRSRRGCHVVGTRENEEIPGD